MTSRCGDRADAVGDDGRLDLAGVGVPGDDAEGGLGVVGEGERGVFCERGRGSLVLRLVEEEEGRRQRGKCGVEKWERTFDQSDEISDREVVALRHGWIEGDGVIILDPFFAVQT